MFALCLFFFSSLLLLVFAFVCFFSSSVYLLFVCFCFAFFIFCFFICLVFVYLLFVYFVFVWGVYSRSHTMCVCIYMCVCMLCVWCVRVSTFQVGSKDVVRWPRARSRRGVCDRVLLLFLCLILFALCLFVRGFFAVVCF